MIALSQIVKTAVALLLRRHSLAMIAGALVLAQLGCKSPELTGDNYPIGEAIVRGTVRDPVGLPVGGATISIRDAPDINDCDLLKHSGQLEQRAVTDSLGKFTVRVFAFVLAHTPSTCVLVNVKPTPASALSDTSVSNIRIVSREPLSGVVLDTASITIVLRAK